MVEAIRRIVVILSNMFFVKSSFEANFVGISPNTVSCTLKLPSMFLSAIPHLLVSSDEMRFGKGENMIARGKIKHVPHWISISGSTNSNHCLRLDLITVIIRNVRPVVLVTCTVNLDLCVWCCSSTLWEEDPLRRVSSLW